MKKNVKNESGAVSLKGVISIIVVILIIYLMAAFFPLLQVPFSLEGKVKELSQSWLRQPPTNRKPADLMRFKESIVKAVEEHLRKEYKYSEKDLVIEATVRSEKIKIFLPYTIVINIFGMEYSFEKELDIEERAWHF